MLIFEQSNNVEMMKKALLATLLAITILAFRSSPAIEINTLAAGEQPQISMDNKGIIRVVFGRKDEIFCSTSNDQGVTFSKSVLVAKVPAMHLGMSRDPQLASSGN